MKATIISGILLLAVAQAEAAWYATANGKIAATFNTREECFAALETAKQRAAAQKLDVRLACVPAPAASTDHFNPEAVRRDEERRREEAEKRRLEAERNRPRVTECTTIGGRGYERTQCTTR